MNAVITFAGHGPLPLRIIGSAAQAASERRLKSLVLQHRELVARNLRRLGVAPGDVDDATQRVFLVVARKMDTIEAGCERAFLLGIASRIASEVRRVEARRQRREVALQIENDAESDARTDELLELKRTRVLLDQLLAAMPSELTTVFLLSEGEGLTASEISRHVGIPVGTVASRLRRARSLFQRQISRLSAPTASLRNRRPSDDRAGAN